jgi:L-asparaginase II
MLAAGMVEVGADLHGAHLALAASSHNGDAIHVRAVQEMLADGGLTEDDLANITALPFTEAGRLEWIRAGGGPSKLTQNCSGKHAAMLRAALAMGAPTEGYLDPEHPVQRVGIAAIERLSGEKVAAVAVDGCGSPVVAISLVGLARAYARMVQADPGTPEGRVARAMSEFPEYVGGEKRDTTKVMRALPGCISKDGSEAVHGLALPDGRALAMKLADGGERARAGALTGVMRYLGVDDEVIAAVAPDPVLGGGKPVGLIEPML